jgi:predicted DCC family thiol-disulfide oxidoreductase YuxK
MAIQKLTVLYDPACALCQRARHWLAAQPQYVRLEFIPAGSELAKSRFPELDPASTMRELTVIGDGGEVYRGAKAWLMNLWALREYRETALRWSTPERLPFARRMVAWVSRYRRSFDFIFAPGRSR